VDVYALGAILFEILTLEPLQGHGSIAAILKRAVQGVDARASVRAPDRDVPPELEVACVRATARDRHERFPSARALADAVEAYLSGDRDLELRKDLAREHRERAEAACEEALASGASEDHRSRALREAARAIALAPEDPVARGVLVRLLTAPPKETPVEVEDNVERQARGSRRVMMPRVALAYFLVPLLLLPFEVLLGVRSWALTLVPMFLWWIAAVMAWLSVKLDRSGRGVFPYVTVIAAVALGASTVLHGPLLVIPAIAAVHAMGMALTTDKRNRVFSTVCYSLGIVVPSLFAWKGLHPVDHAVQADALLISPGALLFPRDGTLAYLGAAHVVIMIVAARFGAAYRDTLTDVQTKNALLNWQLRQLVPEETTREAMAPEASVPSLRASR
jgi:serine/threonine-protein kinase